MAHTYDNKAQFTTGSSDPTTFSYTCGSGTTLLVLLIVGAGTTLRTGGAPTYNGVEFSAGDTNSNVETFNELWYMLNPPTGASYTVSIQNDNTRTIFGCVASFKAATGYGSALRTCSKTTGTTANPGGPTMTGLAAGDVIVSCLGTGDNTFAPSAQTGTVLYTYDPAAYGMGSQYYICPDGTDRSLTWTEATADDWNTIVASFREVANTVLTVADGTHGHTAEGPALTQAHALTVNAAANAHTAEGPTLTQAHSLAVAAAAHVHSAEEPVLELPASDTELVVADGVHPHVGGGLVPDIISESFEGTGYENAWTESGTALDPDSTDRVFAGAGSQCLKIEQTAVKQGGISKSFSSANAVYGEFRFFIDSHAFTSGQYLYILDDAAGEWDTRIYFLFEHMDGVLKFEPGVYYNGSLAWFPIEVDVETEYRVRWRYDVARLKADVWLDDYHLVDLAPTSMREGGMDTLRVGDTSASHNYTITYYIDGLSLSTLGWPDAVALTENKTLAVAAAAHGHAAEAPALTQAHSLAVDAAAHAHAAETPALTEHKTLAVSDGAHVNAAEAPALIENKTLAVADAAHAHVGGGATPDILAESFEGTGFENAGWGKTQGAGCIVDEDSTEVTPPDGGGSQVLKLYSTGNGVTNNIARYIPGGNLAKSWLSFRWRLAALADGKTVWIAYAQDSVWGWVWYVMAGRSGSTYSLSFYLFYDGTNNLVVTKTVSLDTWYQIDIKYDVPGTAYEVRVNGASEALGSLTGSIATGLYYMSLTGTSWQDEYSSTMYFDRLQISSTGWSDALALTQAHTLAVNAGAHVHTAEAPVLVQVHTLAVNDGAHVHAAEAPVLVPGAGADTELVVAPAAHVNAAEAPALTQAHTLAVAAGAHIVASESPALEQAHVLAVQAGAHAHTAETPTLDVSSQLAVADAAHVHAAASPALTQAHTLAVQAGSHPTMAEAPALSQAHSLTVAGSAHVVATDVPTLAADALLAVADAAHGHAGEDVVLAQAHVLAVSPAAHAHLAEHTALYAGTILLIVADAAHVSLAENVTLFTGAFGLRRGASTEAARSRSFSDDARPRHFVDERRHAPEAD